MKCIDSWKKFFPDYEIREWNEDNFDVKIIPYTADAYKAGKYAFVSDYVRFWVLYNYGGVYFDTDVEVIRPMDDVIERGPFMGFELIDSNGRYAIAPGLGLAAEPGMPLYREILERYENLPYFLENGERPPVSMIPLVTDMLKQRGLKGDGSLEHVAGIDVYPPEWFNPFDDATGRLKKTENTRTIHWYAKSWLPTDPAWLVSLKRIVRRVLGRNVFVNMKKLFGKG